MKAKDALLIGGVVGVGVLAWNWFSKLKDAAGAAYDTAVSKTADAIYTVFGPKLMTTDFYYVVNFSGGVKHAIPQQSTRDPDGVDSQGRFTYNGKPFVIRDKKNAAGIVEHWAFTP